MLRNKLVYTAAGFAAGVAMTIATVTGTASPVGADESENAMMIAQKAQIMAVTYQLDNSGLHAIDVSAHEGTIVSGALGNLIDRVRYGYVVDFIRFHLQDGWEWPTFNIADCGITVGVILLVLDGFREGRAEAKEPKAKEPKAKPAAESSGGEAS